MDLAFREVGGFGFSQSLSLFCFMLVRQSGAFLIYGFPYLTLTQEYLCRTSREGDFMSCSAQTDICPAIEADSFVEYKVDSSYEFYFENWYG